MVCGLHSFLSLTISAVETLSPSATSGLICETTRQIYKVKMLLPGSELKANIDNQPMFIINVPGC